MKQRYNVVIGIAGAKNSGKDTVASMIHYIFRSGITSATFQEWVAMYEKPKLKFTVIHFADYLKNILSILFNIDRDLFDDRSYKDFIYYNLRENKFIAVDEFNYNTSNNPEKTVIITTEKLEKKPLAYYIEKYTNPYIKLRTLMQYFGTDIVRKKIEDNRWVKLTIGRAWEIARKEGLCLIPDVRFNNEQRYIQDSKGFVIKINRPIEDKNIDKHDSENMSDVEANYVIENNTSKMSLFYKVLKTVQEIYSIYEKGFYTSK